MASLISRRFLSVLAPLVRADEAPAPSDAPCCISNSLRAAAATALFPRALIKELSKSVATRSLYLSLSKLCRPFLDL